MSLALLWLAVVLIGAGLLPALLPAGSPASNNLPSFLASTSQPRELSPRSEAWLSFWARREPTPVRPTPEPTATAEPEDDAEDDLAESAELDSLETADEAELDEASDDPPDPGQPLAEPFDSSAQAARRSVSAAIGPPPWLNQADPPGQSEPPPDPPQAASSHADNESDDDEPAERKERARPRHTESESTRSEAKAELPVLPGDGRGKNDDRSDVLPDKPVAGDRRGEAEHRGGDSDRGDVQRRESERRESERRESERRESERRDDGKGSLLRGDDRGGDRGEKSDDRDGDRKGKRKKD